MLKAKNNRKEIHDIRSGGRVPPLFLLPLEKRKSSPHLLARKKEH